MPMTPRQPTDIHPPEDHEKPVHFIRTELAARAGAVTTVGSTGIAFVDTLDPYLKFVAGVVAVFVGVATLTYYSLGVVKLWRELKRDEE